MKHLYSYKDYLNEAVVADMSKKLKPTSSFRADTNNDSNIEDDEVKVQEAISCLRLLVSGEINDTLLDILP